jgi:NAD(P)-dependent dehydrogenase (short-subunit alcohol dehydrogenase family)
MSPAGKVALVTGGGRGIGRAVAEKLLHDGMAVAIVEKDAALSSGTAAALSSRGKVHAIVADVAREADVAAAVTETMRHFGRLDALVCNAGISRNKPLAELSLDDWNAVIGTNLTGCFLAAKHAAPHLARHRGCIVTIASTRALMSEPNTEAYSASKGGIVALTHALSVSLGPKVRVNCISPGWIDTGNHGVPSSADHAQHPAGRVGQPADVAALVAWLVSDAAGFMTGANLTLDGGMTRKMIYV